MQKIFRWASITLSVLMLALFYSPKMIELRSTPQVVSDWSFKSSPIFSVNETSDALLVRSGDDERLASVAQSEYKVSLFGLIPLRTVTVAAESEKVCLGGDAVGVILFTDGVQVVGLGSIQTDSGLISPAAGAGLKRGDTILSVNGSQIKSAEHFSYLIDTSVSPCTLSGVRDGKEFSCSVQAVIDTSTGKRRIGAWVRDSTSGVGTLSFYDAVNNRFAALGHAVTDVDTGAVLLSHDGIITRASIFDIERGKAGAAGELLGSFSKEKTDSVGRVETNTEFGIGGTLSASDVLSGQKVELASAKSVRLGEATLYATLDGTTVKGYSCNVIRADVQSSPQTQGMIIEVTDAVLLERTGGIVQGMSGSPVVQNGKLIGIVTHVFINEPKRGFCLYAEWMYEILIKR